MLTKEENERLTRVGPGTPAGELLRRYWHPVAVAQELTDANPTKFIRVLGEDLVLFRCAEGPGARGQGPGNGQGDSLAPDPRSQAPVRVGLIQDHCPHRGASLLYGRVEERGIACAYHGWLYDTSGNCLETPAEPADSKLHLTVKARAYPVQKHVGLYWAYLGPDPVPAIPSYDVWARTDGEHLIEVYPQLDCNWLQAMENSADPAHLQILHATSGGKMPENTTRGFIDAVQRFEFYETPYGLIKKRTYKDGRVDEHPLIFPNILRVSNCTQIRVPIDDTHTFIVFVYFVPGDGKRNGSDEPEVNYIPAFKDPPPALHPFTHFRMDLTLAQDHMAWETQGPIADRGIERLATSDRGVVMFREMVDREIKRVQEGEDPKGVVREAGQAIIDTNLDESIHLGGVMRSLTLGPDGMRDSVPVR